MKYKVVVFSHQEITQGIFDDIEKLADFIESNWTDPTVMAYCLQNWVDGRWWLVDWRWKREPPEPPLKDLAHLYVDHYRVGGIV